ncbi:hypothetical protein OSH10_17260 [Kaistia defluvii]|uniref:phosphotransferase-like protein n=1 Tax=Kaistia defluvii TaxID=410841 RepID=UPI002257079A|nr:hypothetical protein [Kaistia defluvii]MCX5520192.1 hypothetical protein [Kaistia defluvii]
MTGQASSAGPIAGALHRSLKAHANAGNELIHEHILDTDGWLEMLAALLAGHDVFFVGIDCPLELLVEREATRGDRPIGSAARRSMSARTTTSS